MRTASIPEESHAHFYMHSDWEYFGMDDSLVVKAGNCMIVFNTPKKGQILQASIVEINENSYKALKLQAQRQLKLEGQVASQSGLELGVIKANEEASDFTITCNDDVTIPVHVAVLSSFWPFFTKMMSNECAEKVDKRLHLDFPSVWVQQLVSHVYKQKPKMTFDEATGVLILSHMYLLPELGAEASQQIQGLVSDKTTLADLILGWERSREACTDELKLFFARQIAKRDREEQREALKDLKEEQVLELYFDTVGLI